MTTKANKNGPLTQALLETANDIHDIGILGSDAYKKITMRHLRAKKPEIEPLSAEEIRKIREQNDMVSWLRDVSGHFADVLARFG